MIFFCEQWDSNPGPSANDANALCVKLLELINIDHLKVTAFNLSFLCKLHVHVPRVHLVLPMLFLEILSCISSYNICIVLLFDLFRRLLTVKLLKCITRHNILLHLPSGKGNL